MVITNNASKCLKNSLSIRPLQFLRQNGSNNSTLVHNLNNYRSTFPNDKTINENIIQFNNLQKNKYQSQNIKIGIIYENDLIRKESKVVECLLADPLATDNYTWLKQIIERDHPSSFKYSEIFTLHDNQFEIKSPILSELYRKSYFEREEFRNNLIIEELQDLSSLGEFTYLINVSKELSTDVQYPAHIKSKILMNLTDNEEYSPSSTEATPLSLDETVHTHFLKINSKLAFEGILTFIREDVKGSRKYFDNLISSNIYELFKFTDYYSKIMPLSSWYLTNIKRQITHKINQYEENSIESKEINEIEIAKFIDLVNDELQNKFQPTTTNFFNKNLSWWKLYLKNDNVEYDLKDFFNLAFMNKSIEYYNYLNGKLNNDDLYNPLLELKNKVINHQVVEEIQPVVYSTIAFAFLYYQLPITMISLSAYYFFDFSGNSCFALGLLGWVIGFNQVSKNWSTFVASWLNNLFEEVRLCLGKQCVDDRLMKNSNELMSKKLESNQIRSDILKNL